MQPPSFSTVWREAWELLAVPRCSRQAELREDLRAADLAIEADRFRLVQVFRNLLENALAACTDPSRIEISCVAAYVAGQQGFEVRVRDNGAGIQEEQRGRIFEPFFTTKPTGTGLGLAIAQRIVEAHGGSIRVGQPAHGAEIIVELPAGTTPGCDSSKLSGAG
jgi:signal transduction histidine kinase